MFGQDVYVLWDHNGTTTLPDTFPNVQTINTLQVSATKRFNFQPLCCGLERAMMWQIEHQHEFDYVWVMEDDVHYTDAQDFLHMIRQHETSSADLLHAWSAIGVPQLYTNLA